VNHSYSSLTLFEKCPWLFYKKNIQHAPEKTTDNVNMAIGLATHKSIESQLNGASKNVADIQGIKESFLNSSDSSLAYMQSLSYIPDEFISASAGQKVKTEKRLFFNLPTTKINEPFATKFDAYWLNKSTLNIWDWKTSSRIDADSEKQMAFYAMAGIIATKSGEVPVENVVCTLYYLKLHEARTTFYTWTSEPLQEILKWAIDTALEVETCIGSPGEKSEQLYERNRESTECNWCAYRTECFVQL
jgi:hypothetical protein